ncbi:MAG: type II toxin-antitoxin system RelE/ParE family toxin [Actinobacteria bacterium]|nr:type II toxin-antitoxin system RelE/ParE family toxin [Actinomycetota bacterium]
MTNQSNGRQIAPPLGDKKDQYAVRVSGNWSVVFKFIDGDAYIVDYDDYH